MPRARQVRAEIAGGAGDGGTAARLEALEAADGRGEDRQPQRPSEERGGEVHLRHVAQHARPERNRVDRLPVTAHRRLGLRAADQVVPRIAPGEVFDPAFAAGQPVALEPGPHRQGPGGGAGFSRL